MQTRTKTGQMVLVALMAALLAVVSPFTIPVGPVPVTLATFVVFLTGALLRPLPAMASIAVYLLLGFVGLPVFSGFAGGPQVLAGPTGGYLGGYFLAALAVALATKAGCKLPLRLLAALAGLAGCYALGTAWFMVLTGRGLAESLLLCVVPFILPDLIKALLALLLAGQLQKRMAKRS